MRRPTSSLVILGLGLLFVPTVAVAHIHMTYPNVRTSEQKLRHCGIPSARANVNTFVPGATITVTWLETIQHTGWFRISFQENGDVFEIPPRGPTGPNFYPVEDLTGQIDPTSGSLIIADRIPDGSLSLDVTLPNVECNNCTLQLTQFMTSGHGPYTEDVEEADDIYFQCADLILSATAPDAAPGVPDAAPGSPDAAGNPGDPDAGNGGGGSSGGCSAAGGSSGILTVLAMVGLRRRRRVRPDVRHA
jgi:uncharacterized protein (TIGR03382 family)